MSSSANATESTMYSRLEIPPTAAEIGYTEPDEVQAYTIGVFSGMIAAQALTASLSEVNRQDIIDRWQAAAELAGTDPLTGLGNRRTLNQSYQGLQRMERVLPSPGHRLVQDNVSTQTPSKTQRGADESMSHTHSMLRIDVDNFKDVNTTAGHTGGDVYLVTLAKTMKSNTRGNDLVVREGGDEFDILLPRTDNVRAALVAERIRLAVTEIKTVAGHAIISSVSIGVGELDLSLPLVDNMRKIDEALYEAKGQGRNKVVRTAIL